MLSGNQEKEPASKGVFQLAIFGAFSALASGWLLARLVPPRDFGGATIQSSAAVPSEIAMKMNGKKSVPAARRPQPPAMMGDSRDLFVMKGPYRGLENPSLYPEGRSGVSLREGQWDPPAMGARAGDPGEGMAFWESTPLFESPRLPKPTARLRRAFAYAQTLSNEGAGLQAKRADVLSAEGRSCGASECRPEDASLLAAGAFDGAGAPAARASAGAPVALHGDERAAGPDGAPPAAAAETTRSQCEETREKYEPLIAQALSRLQEARAGADRRAACLELADLRCLSLRGCPLTAGIPCTAPDCGNGAS